MVESDAPGVGTLRHQALFYDSPAEYVGATTSFAREGLAAGEPVLIAVPGAKAETLRTSLGQSAGQLQFVDMARLGRNPSRIIPAIEEFLDEHPHGRPHFVGEPIWPGRSDSEVVEATRHEALINLAFAHRAASILCPYDVRGLGAQVVDDATRTHPEILDAGGCRTSTSHTDARALFQGPLSTLSPPPPDSVCVEFDVEQLASVRLLVEREAFAAGLDVERAEDVVVAVNEVATNTLIHTPTTGTLRIWRERARRGQSVVCEVSDRGFIADPLAGRRRPTTDLTGGRGLWLVNQFCDLVQIRSGATGTTVRMHIAGGGDETGGAGDSTFGHAVGPA